jgi:hypothetical protein
MVVYSGSIPLSPQWERGKGSRFVQFSKSEFDSVFHVGVFLTNPAVSPLSLWERVRVRATVHRINAR